MPIRAILTDIEGTTSSISFVKDVLFPYAAKHLPDFVRAHAHEPAVRAELTAAAEWAELPAANAADDEAIIAVLLGWIAADKKATPLKTLQGMIWEAGYKNGDYRAHMYPDAVRKLREWHAAGLDIYVYSSGSILAQKLFFAHTDAGDLLDLFRGHCDTTSGAKREADSYRNILRLMEHAAGDVLFLSDVVEELDAAREAGLHTVWVVRDEGQSLADATHRAVSSFDAIDLAAFA